MKSPEELAQYLDVLRARAVMSARLQFEPLSGSVSIDVVFGPDAGPLPGEAPTPGGWKGPDHLDAPLEVDVP